MVYSVCIILISFRFETTVTDKQTDVVFTRINVKAFFTVCNLFENGAYALIAAVSPSSFETYHAYANLFQIPLVTPWFPEKVRIKVTYL